jgi:photosystem II stability/assembly factor-like uncharacterized protein
MSVRVIAVAAALAVLSGCSGGGKPVPTSAPPSIADTAAATASATQSAPPMTSVALPAGCTRNPALAERVEAMAVSFVDAQRGFAIGWADDIPATQRDGHPCPVAWATTDGGASWSALAILPASYITGLQFTSAMDGWAWGTDALFVTHDGGHTWEPVALEGEIADFEATAGNAWLLERGACPSGGPTTYVTRDEQGRRAIGATPPCPFELRLSSDGGATWHAPLRPPPVFPSQPVMGRNGAAGLIAARADPSRTSGLWATADGGETWSPLPSLTGQEQVIDIVIIPSGDIHLLAGGPGAGTFQPKAILRSSDGGRTWATIADSGWVGGSPIVGNLSESGHAGTLTVTPSVMFLPMGRGELWASSDTGQTWTAPLGYNEVSPGDSGPGRAVCLSANCWLPVAAGVHRSVDGGHTWTLVALPEP